MGNDTGEPLASADIEQGDSELDSEGGSGGPLVAGIVLFGMLAALACLIVAVTGGVMLRRFWRAPLPTATLPAPTHTAAPTETQQNPPTHTPHPTQGAPAGPAVDAGRIAWTT